LDSAIYQKVQYEIEQIDELLGAAGPIIDLCKIREPDFVEGCGIALILQSFYNGIEKILLLIMKNKDVGLPNGIKWHKELFDNAFMESNNRTHIFRKKLYEQLNDYLKFRHFARHTYGFQLKWEIMKNLLFDMNILWEKIKEDIILFMKSN
jgi:hypothetical protein